MTRTKRLIASLLGVALLVGVVAAPASASKEPAPKATCAFVASGGELDLNASGLVSRYPKAQAKTTVTVKLDDTTIVGPTTFKADTYTRHFSAPGVYTATFINTLAGGSKCTVAPATITAPPVDAPPVLALPANFSVEATGPSGALATFTATATDVVDGTDPVFCSPASGSVFAQGSTTVNCSATDTALNTAYGSFVVTVTDTTSPVTDIAGPAGIAQTDQSYDTLVFDYNGDGLQDFLYSPQNDPTGRQLWRNNGDGTFTLVAHLKGSVATDQHGCTTADFDGNGLPDVYCAMGAVHGTRTKANPLWLQQTDGSWLLDETSGAQDGLGRGRSASTADFNGDGLPDLFVDNFHPRPDGQPTPDRVFLNLGSDPITGAWLGFAEDGTSGIELEQGNRGCDFTTDFNHDGHADIVFCGSQRMFFYAGDGAGHFTDASAAVGLANFFTADAQLVDVTGDGIADLVYAKLGQWGVRPGKTNGTFGAAIDTHTETAGRMVSVADADGNGTPDVYVLQGNGVPGCTTCLTNYPDQLWTSDGLGHFTQVAIPEASGGSGDTVDAIQLAAGQPAAFIVGNGANLIRGPLQLIAQTAAAAKR